MELVDGSPIAHTRSNGATRQVIPTPLHVLAMSRPFPPRVSSFFARFHRLDEAVATSPKPEPRAKKQPARPRGPPSIQALSAYGTNQLD